MAFGGDYNAGLGTNGFEVSLNYITGVPDPNQLASTELQLCFKGLQKKDSTTRDKSIQALLKTVQEQPQLIDDQVVIISWCQMFAKLAIDDSKRVRSGSHQVQAQFVQSLGKKFAKYLRDTIGVWMAGLFDSDRSVAKECKKSLTASFGDKTGSLWKIYAQQLLNYSHEVFAFETKETLSDERFTGKDESEAKYRRVVLGAVLLFTQLLNKSQEQPFELKEQSQELVLEILRDEKFQKLFSTKDLNLKKSVYQLLRVVVTSKESINLIDSALYTDLAGAAVSGLKIRKKTNPVLYSGSIITILDCLVVLTKHNPSFWTSNKKADERLQGILSIGSVGSDPVYYEVVSALLNALPTDFLPLEGEDTSAIEPYLTILRNDVSTERLPEFQQRAWKTYLGFLKDHNLPEMKFDKLTALMIKALDTPRPSSKQLLTVLSSVSDDTYLDINSGILDALPCRKIEYTELELDEKDSVLTVKYEDQFIANFVSLLATAKSDLLEELLDNSVDALNDEYDDDPSLSFETIDVYLKKGVEHDYSEFIDSLDTYVTKTFTDLPMKVLIDYSGSADEISTATNKLFLKYKELGKADYFMRNLSHVQGFNVDDASDIKEYLLQKSDTSAEEDTHTLYGLLTPEILENIYSNSSFANFVENCLKQYHDGLLSEFAVNHPEFIGKLQSSKEKSASELLAKLERHLSDEQFQKSYFLALSTSLEEEKVNSLLIKRISTLGPEIQSFVPDQESLLKAFTEVLPTEPNSKLAIANPLGTSLYLFGQGGEFDSTGLRKLLLRCFYYAAVIKKYPNASLATTIAAIAEAGADLIFLDSSLTENMRNWIISLQKTSLGNTSFEDQPAETVLAADSKIQEIENASARYYFYRVYQQVLADKEQCDPPRGLKPPMMAVYLDCNKHRLASEQFSYPRNGTIANIVGARSSKDILGRGLESLLLLNKFIDLDSDYQIPEGLELFPAQRFMMALNTISAWPDCDIAYDPEFVPVRIALLEFIMRYIKNIYYVCDSNYPSDFIDKVFELGWRICSESLNIEGSIELTFYALKCYLVLSKYKDQIESWEEDDVVDDFVNILFAQLKSTDDNQPNLMVNELVGKLDIPQNKLIPKYSEFYSYISSTTVDVQKLSVSILSRLLPKIQDDLVVECSLEKTKEAHLPSILLENINNDLVMDDFDYQPQHDVNTFLWSWYIVLMHFNKISQQMKDFYTADLGENKINDFLTFLVTEIDVGKFKCPINSDPAYIQDYQLDDDDTKKLLVNLLFNSMKYWGGSVTQTWYLGIRDKQLKQNTYTFMKKYISPSLIDDMMNTLSDKSTIEDDDFKIKVNRQSNEIKCVAEIDDQQMETSIVLPADYPLSQITVNGISRVGVDEKKWKSWLMSSQYVINFQNVSILDAIRHFKENIEHNFEGYDDCAICYSIINAIDHTTPNKVCPTCHHNFHSACLYRWFKSSGSSTCPLCRGKFSFKKHS